MAEIPDMALIFIRQYQTCLYIKEVIIWDSRLLIVYLLNIKDIACNLKEFKRLLKDFLYSNSFYTLEEYFQYNNNNNNNNNNNMEFVLENVPRLRLKEAN